MVARTENEFIPSVPDEDEDDDNDDDDEDDNDQRPGRYFQGGKFMPLAPFVTTTALSARDIY